VNGHCHCPCLDWGDHEGICTGTFERSLPKYPYLEGFLMLPCCGPCYAAIQAVTDRRAITPPPPGVES
jgi:hypothetical protein